MTIDRALSGNPFEVDQFRCQYAADRLRGFRPVVHREVWNDEPKLSQLVFKSLFISICQQFNWDFLQSAMASWLLPRPDRRLRDLAAVRASDIEHLLRDYPRPERIRARERAGMLRVAAVQLQQLLDQGILRSLIQHRRLDGPDGFYQVMKSVSAYAADEMEKKVRVLAHDLYRERIIEFRDPQHLRPAVEYHILRLYIRTGRVHPTDESVREQLLIEGARSRTRLVRLLRRAVEQAMDLTAFYANIDVATLNYLEWQIGRSVCTPTDPHCDIPAEEELPAEIAALSPCRCLYSDFCRSFNEPRYGWYHEPHFQKAIY